VQFHHTYSIDYYSSFAKIRALDASGNPINELEINTKTNKLEIPE